MRTFRLPENDIYAARRAASQLSENLTSVLALRFSGLDDSEYRQGVENELKKLAEAMGGTFCVNLPTSTRTTNSERSERGLSADDRADMERDDRMNERAA